MNNPLNKRIYRDIKSNKSKYLVLFLFISLTISFCSGSLVCEDSLKKSYKEGFEKNNVEDAHIVFNNVPEERVIKKMEANGVDVYPMYYVDFDCGNTQLRIYEERDGANKTKILRGREPKKVDEIVIDRLYAKENKIDIGNNI